jgi:5'-nucleotidase
LDWERTAALAARAVERVLGREMQPGVYWNVNLPHPAADDELSAVPCVDCDIDPHPQDVRFASQECGGFLYAGRYRERPRQPGSDVDVCFSGQISISRLALA